MALDTPRLDDRSFQDLVDDAKRFVQERCPEWTDHNVSDPGVTLIETFAWMTDLLLFRLNRVPDRVYVKFLDLLGVTLFPPTAARVEVDFRLSAPQDSVISVPAATVVATPRTTMAEPVSFTTLEDVDIVPAEVVYVGSGAGEDDPVDLTPRLGIDTVVPFADPPAEGDALYVGLDQPVPMHTVLLSLACEQGRGHGIEPDRPPLRWEAHTDEGWEACDVTADGTLGFNTNGHVELHVPSGHRISTVGGRRMGLLRCRVVSHPRIKPYTESPGILSLDGRTIGATVEAINAELATEEVLGQSSGVAGQEFTLQHGPVLPSDTPFVVRVVRPELPGEAISDEAAARRADLWELRPDFADSGPDDPHVALDRVGGTVRFGPLIREEDGSTRRLGAVPPKGALLTVPQYRFGGGARGNVTSGAISVLRSSIPFVASVANRRPARGGVDGETLSEAKVRGPVQLRTRNRAVTAEDFEVLTREAAPGICRVRCVPDTEEDQPGCVRVLIVPSVDAPDGRVRLEDLLPSDELCATIEAHLDERRMVGTRVRVEPAQYAGVQVHARIAVQPHADPAAVADAALTTLYRYLNPVSGGSGGNGWAFGRSTRVGEIFGVLQRLSGLDVVEELTLYSVDLASGETEDVGSVLELYPNELVFSQGHEVVVVDQ
jgi:predicted phage baseplate assembly protein